MSGRGLAPTFGFMTKSVTSFSLQCQAGGTEMAHTATAPTLRNQACSLMKQGLILVSRHLCLGLILVTALGNLARNFSWASWYMLTTVEASSLLMSAGDEPIAICIFWVAATAISVRALMLAFMDSSLPSSSSALTSSLAFSLTSAVSWAVNATETVSSAGAGAGSCTCCSDAGAGACCFFCGFCGF